MQSVQCEHTHKKTNKRCMNRAFLESNGKHAYCSIHTDKATTVLPKECEWKEELDQLRAEVSQLRSMCEDMKKTIAWLEINHDKNTFDFV